MPTPSARFADKANLKDLFAGLKSKYEPKDATIVRDASYVHTDANFTQAEKEKLGDIAVRDVDGTTIAVDANGVISLALASLDGVSY